MSNTIAQKISQIKQSIPPQVQLIAITKYVGLEAMREAYGAGVRDFGENRVPEALNKQEQLQDLADLNWHFIGHIQKNKAKKIVQNFSWIHSVDSLSLAQRLDRLAGECQRKPKVFLQVKVLPDPHKYGWEVDDLWPDLPILNQCHQLEFQGLMTILPLGLTPEETSQAFQKVETLAKEINTKRYSNLNLKELSMGMSGDYHLAIAAGATMIRLGRTIFKG